MPLMNLKDLVVVAIRLLALEFALRIVTLLPQLALYFTEGQKVSPASGLAVLPLTFCVVYLCGAILLWAFAKPIGEIVSRGLSPELSFGRMSLADCYTIAFVGMGVFNVSNCFPQALNWALFLFQSAASSGGTSWKEGVNWQDVFQAEFPFVFGVVLFANGRRWALKLAARQTTGELPPETNRPADENGR